MGMCTWLLYGAYMAVSARSMGSGRVLKSLTDKPSSKLTIASSFTKIKPMMSLLHEARPPSQSQILLPAEGWAAAAALEVTEHCENYKERT